jgi:hypothetical protein
MQNKLNIYSYSLSAGTAGFVGAFWIGPRTDEDLEDAQPNNVLMMLVGAGILWSTYWRNPLPQIMQDFRLPNFEVL